MSSPPDPIATSREADRERTLRLAHRAALVALAGCAVLIATQSAPTSSEALPPAFPYAAFGLGIAAIAFRQSAASTTRPVDTRIRLAVIGYALTAAIGGVGLVLVALEGQRQAGLLYTMGGAILALRPAAAIAEKQS